MRCVVNATPQPLYPRERDPVPILQEAGWAPGPVLMVAEYLTSTGIRSPEPPARIESLYETSILEFEKWNKITQDVIDEIKQTKKIRPCDLNWLNEPYTM